MSKKKVSVGLSCIFGMLMVILAVVAAITPSMNSIKGVASSSFLGVTADPIYESGFSYIFGSSDDKISISVGLLVAWIMLLVSAVGGILGILNALMGKNKNISRYVFACSGLIAIAAGIMFFCALPLAGIEGADIGVAKLTYSLSTGFIISGIAGIAGGLSGIVALFAK